VIAHSIPEGTPRPTFSESNEVRGVTAVRSPLHPGGGIPEGERGVVVIASRRFAAAWQAHVTQGQIATLTLRLSSRKDAGTV